MIDGVIYYETTSTAGVKDAMISVFSTGTVEVGGGECSCMKGGPEDSLAFAVCTLMDYSIVDVEIADVLGSMWSMVCTDESEGVMTGVARVVSHPLTPWMVSVPHLSLRGSMSHPCWISGSTEKGRWGVINRLCFFLLHVWVDDVSEDRDVAEV